MNQNKGIQDLKSKKVFHNTEHYSDKFNKEKNIELGLKT